MKQLMLKSLLKLKKTAKDFVTEENGEANIIAIILIIIVVIALAGIFWDELEKIVMDLFARIRSEISGF